MMRNHRRAQHEGEQENSTVAEQQVATAATTMSGSSSSKRSRSTDSPHAADHNNNVRRKRLAVRNHHHMRPAADPLALVYQDYCELPFTLKTVLVEEYERITSTRLRLVHALPAPVPVSKVLQPFCQEENQGMQVVVRSSKQPAAAVRQ